MSNVAIEYCDLFHPTHQCFAHAVNPMGIMAAGVANEIKKRFTHMLPDYERRCDFYKYNPQSAAGDVVYYQNSMGDGLFNLFAMTGPGKGNYDYLEACLHALVLKQGTMKIPVVYAPALCCGLGKLHFPTVKMIADECYKDNRFDIKLVFCLRELDNHVP